MLGTLANIPPRLLQFIGAAALGGVILSVIKEALSEKKEESGPDVPLATTHPSVPTNLFSSMFRRENRANFRSMQDNVWLLTYGDKVCHTTLSLLLYISQGAKLPSSDPETRRSLFALYLQAGLAETRLQMVSNGRSAKKADAMLNCIAATILDTPLEQLEHYGSLLALSEDERRDTVAEEAVRRLGAPGSVQKHFSAAYVLLRTVTLLLVLNA
jgi:hypothetical protein